MAQVAKIMGWATPLSFEEIEENVIVTIILTCGFLQDGPEVITQVIGMNDRYGFGLWRDQGGF